jgi:hypothetical protein
VAPPPGAVFDDTVTTFKGYYMESVANSALEVRAAPRGACLSQPRARPFHRARAARRPSAADVARAAADHPLLPARRQGGGRRGAGRAHAQRRHAARQVPQAQRAARAGPRDVRGGAARGRRARDPGPARAPVCLRRQHARALCEQGRGAARQL